MAVSISLIFGRLGTVSGTNMVALLLDDHCEMVFYLSGSSLIGDIRNIGFFEIICKFIIIFFLKNIVFLLPVAGLLSFFIPKIHQKPNKSLNEPRVSVLSSR